MRPIRLEVEGLHSFREKVEIDFNQLSEVGVFGIFGPTGSGKSTLLDAITLALYGAVGRAGRGTQGILNHAEKSLSVSFEFSIGSGEGKKVYRIDRRYRRNGEINVSNTVSRIAQLHAAPASAVVLAEKANEVAAKVEEILGLRVDDFTRAVVLPQGKFAEFLHLKGKDRIDMLQRLFSLGQYGTQLAVRLNHRIAKVETHLLEVSSVQVGLGDASKETLAHEQAQWQEAQQAERTTQEVLGTVQHEYKQAEQLKLWQEERSQLLEKFAAHEARSEEIKRVKQRLSLSERAEKVLPFVKAMEQAALEQSSLEADKRTKEQHVEVATAESEASLSRLEVTKKNRDEQEPALLILESKLEAAQELEDQLEELNPRVVKSQAELDQKVTEQKLIEKKLNTLQQQRTDLQGQVKEQQQVLEKNQVTPAYRQSVSVAKEKADAYIRKGNELQAADSEVKTRQQELESGQEELTSATNGLTECEKNVVRIQEQLASLPSTDDEDKLSTEFLAFMQRKGQVQRLLEKETELAQTTKALNAKQQELGKIEQQVEKAAAELQEAQEQTAKLRQKHKELILQDKKSLATRLAADLCAGEACLVCGSLEHPHPAKASSDSIQFTQLLEETETSIEEAEQIETEKRTHALKINESMVQIQTQVESLRLQFEESSQQVAALLLGLQQELSSLQGTVEVPLANGQEMSTWFEEKLTYIQEQREQCNEWKAMRVQKQQEIEALQSQRSEQNVRVAACQEKVNAASVEAERARKLYERVLKEVAEAKKLLDQDVSALGYDTILTAINDLAMKDQLVEKAQEQLKKWESDLSVVETSIEESRSKETGLKVEVKGIEAALIEHQKQLQEKREKLFQTTTGRKVQDIRVEVTTKLSEIRQQLLTAQEEYEQKQQAKSTAEQRFTESKARWEQAFKNYGQHEQVVAEKLQEYQFATTGEVLDAQLTESELHARQQEVQSYQEEEKHLLVARIEVEEKIQGKQLSEEQWQEISVALETATSDLHAATTACGAARERFLAVQKKHARWMELEEQRVTFAGQLSQLNELKKVLRGNDFVEFLAKEQLEYVARQASERLKQLTRNRYALEVDLETGFVMRDDANGSVRRPVSSLSGGETFLTSLALALSLSTQIQLRGQHPLEFFFLDEGFGTLDPELLEVVMSTLEQLHMEKMTIGVISHVPELRQRMNRRLIVEPAEASGRGSRVRMEKA